MGQTIFTIREAAWVTNKTYRYEEVVRMLGEMVAVLRGRIRVSPPGRVSLAPMCLCGYMYVSVSPVPLCLCHQCCVCVSLARVCVCAWCVRACVCVGVCWCVCSTCFTQTRDLHFLGISLLILWRAWSKLSNS